MNETLRVNFGFDRNYVLSAFSADISTADSILDLIDNSIDAARRNIAQKNSPGDDSFSLPDSYEGYEIRIDLNNDEITISDNCNGIEEETLENNAFRLGARTPQEFSIGAYGVGLIRAFWKLGNGCELNTDTGNNAFILLFSKQSIDDSDNILADRVETTGRPHNIIKITNLTPEVNIDVKDSEWKKRFAKRLSKVYGLCIHKGLKIQLGRDVIEGFCPQIRSDLPDFSHEEEFETTSGVQVKCQIGIHENYRYKDEKGWALRSNSSISNEFGWYIVCNDRVVLIADTSEAVGWTAKYHTEYNGILGWAFFKSKESNLLPWDTTKTNISLEKRSQIEAAKRLKRMSDDFRKKNKKRYDQAKNKPKPSLSPPPSGPPPRPPDPPPGPSPRPPEPPVQPPPPSPIPDTLEYSGELSSVLKEILKSPKLERLYYSLRRISLSEDPILASVGIWVFIECFANRCGKTHDSDFTSFFMDIGKDYFTAQSGAVNSKTVKQILNRIKNYGNLDKHDRSWNTGDARNFRPDMAEITPFLIWCAKNNNPDQ